MCPSQHAPPYEHTPPHHRHKTPAGIEGGQRRTAIDRHHLGEGVRINLSFLSLLEHYGTLQSTEAIAHAREIVAFVRAQMA